MIREVVNEAWPMVIEHYECLIQKPAMTQTSLPTVGGSNANGQRTSRNPPSSLEGSESFH